MSATEVRSTKSTIVRPNSARLSALRAGFSVLDRVAPSMAARWALRLWCTLPKGSGRRQDNRPRPGIRSSIRLSDGRQIAVETWNPSPPTAGSAGQSQGPVYLVHGWGGWRGQLGAFVDPLLGAGRRVVAFDVPSHGESSPSLSGKGRATAVDFVDALKAVVDTHGEPHGIVAHSMGCATTALALRDGMNARYVVFIASAPDPIGTTVQLRNVLGYGSRTDQRFFTHLKCLAGRPLDDFNALLIRSDADVPPALVIHDRQDKESPYDDGVRLAEAWPEAELVTTDGLGHQRILLDEYVTDLTATYLAKAS